MSDYNIQYNRPEPSDEEILKHKDFNSVKQQYQVQKGKFQWNKYWTGGTAVVTVAAASALYLGTLDNEKNQIPTTRAPELVTTEHKREVHPPFDGIDVPFETYIFEAQKGAAIKTVSGSILRVPPHAFVDEQGQVVENTIELRYRDFHHPFELLISGIPMTIDTLGEELHFESAGMMEVRASSEGRELALAEGQQIDVELVSLSDDPEYDLYYFDEAKGQWDNLGDVMPVAEAANVSSEPSLLATEEVPSTMTPPTQAGKTSYLFELDFNADSFPELTTYDNVLFEVDESKAKFNPDLYQVKWEKIDLKRSETENRYHLILSRKDTSVSVQAYPVLKGKDYQKAMIEYNGMKSARSERLEREKNFAVEEVFLVKTDVYQEDRDESMMMVSEMLTSLNTDLPRMRRRGMSVFTMGILNLDVPRPPRKNEVLPYFSDPNGNSIVAWNTYSMDPGKNALLSWPGGNYITYHLNKPNLIWIVTKEGQIGLVTEEGFEGLYNGKKEHTFIVEEVNRDEGLRTLYHLMKDA